LKHKSLEHKFGVEVVDVVEDVLDVSTHIDPEIENKTRSVLNHTIQARKKK